MQVLEKLPVPVPHFIEGGGGQLVQAVKDAKKMEGGGVSQKVRGGSGGEDGGEFRIFSRRPLGLFSGPSTLNRP
jgi:hypothetical protein